MADYLLRGMTEEQRRSYLHHAVDQGLTLPRWMLYALDIYAGVVTAQFIERCAANNTTPEIVLGKLTDWYARGKILIAEDKTKKEG